MRERCKDPEVRKMLGEISRNAWKDPERRKKMGDAARKRWEDPEFRVRTVRAIMKAQHIHPNKPETILWYLLHTTAPGEYDYTGDGARVFGGFAPDFANCNGQKKLIEMNGDYWHTTPKNMEKDARKLQSYAKLGYSCLIIWEHELEDPEAVIERILEFTEVKKSA